MATILIADDRSADRALLIAILDEGHHRLLQAESGEDALETVRHEHPDLIISDVMMPTMDGYELVRQIRADPSIANTPVLLYTASFLPSEVSALADACGVHVLAKPGEPEDVLRAVDEILTLPRAQFDGTGAGFEQAHLRLLTDKLGQTQEQLLLAVHGSNVGIWDWNVVTNEASYSPQLTGTLGYLPSEFAANHDAWRDRLHPDDRDSVLAAIARHLDGRSPEYEAECRLRHKDGTYRWMLSRGQCHRDPTGRVVRMAGSQIDITRLKLAEADARQTAQLLWESEQRTRFALEAARAGVWVAEPESGRVTWSDSMCLVHGIAPGTFGGTVDEFLALVHPDDRESVVAAIREHAARPGDFEFQFRFVRADGECRWMQARGQTQVNDTGSRRVLGISQDVTDRKVLEGQVAHAQRMEAVGQLAGGLSHDFNNLLTVILGYANLLSGRVSGRALADVEAIRSAAQRATQLIGQLLAFSRRQILQPKVLNLDDVVAGPVQLLRRVLGEHIRLEVRRCHHLDRVRVDAGQIEQVLLNLALNARDAMPRGGTLTIETSNVNLGEGLARKRLQLAPGPYVLLAVRDTGIGMDAGTRTRIFEPFFTTKELGKGTGLGLASVFGIVKQSGGSISVDSELGQGATFRIYLPRAEAALEPSRIVPLRSRLHRGSETILLVEDEGAVRTLMHSVLARAGYRVLPAADATEARQIATRAQSIDLLLTDVILPGPLGSDLFERLRRRRPALRVLYVSGFADDAVIHHGVLEPGTPFLPKPFTAPALTKKVREVLDQPQSVACEPGRSGDATKQDRRHDGRRHARR